MSPVHMLVVDDHRLFRKGIIAALRSLRPQWVFAEAENGQEAIDFVTAKKPIHCIMMDIAMPVVNGIEACRKIKQSHPSLPIVILTQFDENALILHLLDLGANGYLSKNTDPEKVIVAIEMVLHSGQYITEEMLRALQTSVGVIPENRARVDLTNRDREIICFLCKGMSTKEIAGQMHLTETSVESYRKDLLHKTRTHNVAELISFIYRTGLLSLPSENKVPQHTAFVVSPSEG